MMPIKSRPIPFRSELATAIRDGRKTQTRRIATQLNDWDFGVKKNALDRFYFEDGLPVADLQDKIDDTTTYLFECPYGDPGDRLWIREDHFRFGYWEPIEGVTTRAGKQKWRFVGEQSVAFNPPGDYRVSMDKQFPHVCQWYKRLGRFMPRWASRTTVELVSRRIERLQDIDDAAVIAEGLDDPDWHKTYANSDGDFIEPEGIAVEAFADLWREINGPESWEQNPWVWRLEFKLIEGE